MSEQIEKIVIALHKLINGIALSETEKQEIEAWKSRSGYNKDLYDEIKYNPEAIMNEVKHMITKRESKALWKKITQQLPNRKNKLVSLFQSKPLQYAAAILILIGLSTFFIFRGSTNNKQQTTITDHQPPSSADIPPGTDGAVLTLSDGKQIILDNTGKGETIAQEGSARVIKSEDGQLVYQLSGNDHSGDEARMNTVVTAKGKQFRLILPDGSKVFLNAASSISYPTAFTGKDRSVKLTGEAFFEVAKDAKKTFKVTARDMTVEVLGTHFNLNSYDDENTINTTLVEGMVKVSKGAENSFIKPGQQAKLNSSGKLEIVNNADIDEITAWRNGFFQFQDADINSIMRQVQRWYDAEVVYKGVITRKFYADIPRNVSIVHLMDLLAKTGWMRYNIEGKKITIIPAN